VRGLTLSGVVVTDGITSREALALLPALRISAYVPGTPSSSSALRTNSSGTSALEADGSFHINGLRPGHATINLNWGSNAALRAFSIVRIERDGVQLPQGFDIEAGQNPTGLQVYVTYGMGTIRGTVAITGGMLPADARLVVRASRPGPSNAGNSTQVDSRGHFALTNLAPGTYELTLQRYPTPQYQPPRRPPPPLKQTVSVADGAETEITFTLDLSSEGGP
jgi:hypothetical protein